NSGSQTESLGVRSHAVNAITNLLLLGFQERFRRIEEQLIILTQRKEGPVDHQNNKDGGHRSPDEQHPHKRRNTRHGFSSLSPVLFREKPSRSQGGRGAVSWFSAGGLCRGAWSTPAASSPLRR